MMTVVGNVRALRPNVFVLDQDYDRLADLVCASAGGTAGLTLLWAELERATVLPYAEAPLGLVRMGSTVRYTDRATGDTSTVRLIYPHEAASPATASVASSLGAALIGLCAGDEIEWRAGDGQLRQVRIDAVEPPAQPRPKQLSLAEFLAGLSLEDVPADGAFANG